MRSRRSPTSRAASRSRRRGRRPTTSPLWRRSCVPARRSTSAPSSHRPLTETIDAAIQLRRPASNRCRIIAVRNFADAQDLEDIPRAALRRGRRALAAADRRRPRPAGRSITARHRGDRQRPPPAPRHSRYRHCRLSGRTSAHCAARPRHRAGRQDRGSRSDRPHASTSSRSSASTPTRSSAGSGGCAEFGIEHPVRIGLAGPTSLSTLLRYAKRCGVRASAQALARQTGLMRQLFAMSAPDPLVRTLAKARAERPDRRDRAALLFVRRARPQRPLGNRRSRTATLRSSPAKASASSRRRRRPHAEPALRKATCADAGTRTNRPRPPSGCHLPGCRPWRRRCCERRRPR